MWGGTKGNKIRTASSQEEEHTIKKKQTNKKSITDGKTCGVIWINTQSFKRSIFIFHVHTHRFTV